MTVEVFELRLTDAPTEVWYGVKVNGRSLQAGWADPDAARRRGEEYARELRSRRGGTMETENPDPKNPDEPDEVLPSREVEREVERETETETVTVVPDQENDDAES